MVYMGIWKRPSRGVRLSKLTTVNFPQKMHLCISQNLGVLKRKPSRYWNWFLDGGNLTASSLLDGSPYSFGGDGVFVLLPPNRFAVVDLAPIINATWNLTTLEGTGGGCVTTGPFAGWTFPFGLIGPNLTDSIRDNLINIMKYNPHCLTRSFKPKTAAYSFTQASLDAVLQSSNITEFNKRLSSLLNPAIPTIFNLHDKGHQGMLTAIYIITPTPVCYKKKI